MKLAQLQKLINEVNTLGFDPEQVDVEINYTFSKMKINSVKTEVRAGDDVQPVVKIDLSC
jgi:hypothetical protein